MAGRQNSSSGGVTHEPLTSEQILAATLDPAYFIDNFCYIRGKGGVTERFRLWDFQREVIHTFDDERRVLVLKARQLGVSWLTDAYALWLCTVNKGQSVMLLSQGQRESKEEMRRIRFMHKRLPPELKRKTGGDMRDAHTPDTTEHMEFPDMDSRIISLPSTEHAGTSFTATLVIIHELAKIQMSETLMAAIVPTMADGGRLFVVSTAFGFSGTFYNLWQTHGKRWHTGQIVGDESDIPGQYRPIFVPWSARPGRDAQWYAATEEALNDSKKMKQEYPASPTEAFQGSADSVFSEEFDRHTHALDGTRHPGSTHDVVHAMDLGINHAYTYWIEVQGRSVFIYRELHVENGSVQDLAAATIAEDKEQGLDPLEIVSYPDPAGVARNLQTLKTDYDVLKEEGLLVDEDSHKASPAQRVGLIKQLLKTGRFWVSLDCPDLLDALEKAQWKHRRAAGGTRVREDTYEKDGVFEHPLDAVGYALCRIFPPVMAAAVDTEEPVMEATMGSEFG